MRATLLVHALLGLFAALRPTLPEPPAKPTPAIAVSCAAPAPVKRKPVARKIPILKGKAVSGTDNSNSSYAALGIRAVCPADRPSPFTLHAPPFLLIRTR